jgi:capsular exopolysaccharide synthesis family protein
MALAVLVGLIVGVGLAFFIEYLDTSVKTLEDVEKFLGVPVLAVIPKNVELLIKHVGEESPDAEAFRILRTNIEFNRKNPDANTLTVISGGPGEGKSTTLCNLAYTCAKGGYNVLLVDADLRRPSQHRNFEVENTVGLTDYLTGNAPFENFVQPTKLKNLSFIPSGILPADSVGILNSQRMSDLIFKAKRQYDLVFLDSPPILGVSDGSVIASEVDLTVMVIEHRRFPRSMLQRVKSAVANVGGTLLGVVLNKVDTKHDQGYQYYTNYYDYYSPQRPEKSRTAGAKTSAASSHPSPHDEQY